MALHVALGRLQKLAGPDARVTASAEGVWRWQWTGHYTGVWDAAGTGPLPLAWLVSGTESNPADLPVVGSDAIELVGAASSGTSADIRAPRGAILSNDVPGQTGAVRVGDYAWWVGDEGVKAAVAQADRTTEITYAPFDAVELRRRIRQQLSLGAGAVDASGEPVFEPRDEVNASVVSKIIAASQLAFLMRPDGTTAVGPDAVRQNFPNWTTGASAVLATTKPGGLRRDLSLRPDLLGPAFAAWMDYCELHGGPRPGVAVNFTVLSGGQSR